MAMEIKSIVHFPEQYFKTLEVANKYAMTGQRRRYFRETMQTFEFVQNDTLHVLAVGAGNGMMDIPVIGDLSKQFQQIFYVVVDPVKSEVQKFQELTVAKHSQSEWENVDFEFNVETIEEYLQRIEKNEKAIFDIIHIVHSAYYFADPETTMVKLYHMLKRGGRLLNIMVGGSYGQLFSKLGKHYNDPNMCFFGSDDMVDMLRHRLPDVHISVVSKPKAFEISKCFIDTSEDGNHILDFLTQILHFRKFASKKIVDEVMSFLKDEGVVQSNGEIFFSTDDGHMTIFNED
ncbi:histamine N-methyltransferase-like [Glandiceps talaboti]